jgi:thiosulfate reductase / polysulfide reductase chain A
MGGWTRRKFLAAGALGTVGTAGFALENGGRLLRPVEKPWNVNPGRSLHKYRDPLPTACTACGAACPILAFRDGDRVVQIGPNPAAAALSAPCARAYASLEALYDAERVLRPRLRAGHRGEGKWREISWPEAIEVLGRALREAPDRAYFDVGRPDPLAGELLEVLQVAHRIEEGASRTWSAREAQRAVYGAPLGRPDFSRARTILLLGARPLDEGSLYGSYGRELAEAKARGATIIAAGAYQGVTGSFANEWIPVRPGTEALVALALAQLALSEGRYDREAFARFAGASAERLGEELLPYRPEQVEAIAEVPVRALVRVARRLAAEGPSLTLVESEGSRQAETLEAAAALLNSLGGDPEASGVRLAGVPGFVPAWEPTEARAEAVAKIVAATARPSVYFAYRTNPVYASSQSAKVREAFADEGRVGLLVAMDAQVTETALLADLLLPAATDLEMWNLLGGYAPDGKSYAVLQQPATRRLSEPALLTRPGAPLEKLFDARDFGPLGDAKQLGDALLEVLAAGQHPARGRFPADCAASVQALGASLVGEGFGPSGRGFWSGVGPGYPQASERGFPTPTKRLRLEGRLTQPIPADPKSAAAEDFALVLLRYPELRDDYANTRWGREIRHRNPLLMNPSAARRVGVSEGDRVLVRTEAGEGVAHAVLINGIHPQAVALAEDFGHWAGGVAATAEARATGDEPKTLLVERRSFLGNPLATTVQQTQPGEVPWWHHEGPGLSVWGLLPSATEEAGSPAWKEVRVSLHRV